jgi:hypothetical protein
MSEQTHAELNWGCCIIFPDSDVNESREKMENSMEEVIYRSGHFIHGVDIRRHTTLE